jgi:serine protease SohB
MGFFSNKSESEIKVISLNKAYKKYIENFESKSTLLSLSDEIKQESKVYVLTFNGSLMAEEVNSLRKEVTSILMVANKNDEIIINIYSPGGSVDGYGLVAEQIDRLRRNNLHVTAVVDRVAASGGYMIASVADKIVVAKRAVIGSIGVVTGIPNYSDIMKKIGVGFKYYTAGKYKRTVTPFNEPTKEEENKLNEELIEYHEMFKKHVSSYRKNVDIEKVSTGETWLGDKALELGLVDEIGVSDDVITKYIIEGYDVYEVKYFKNNKEGFLKKLMKSSIDYFVDKMIKKIEHYFQSKMIGRK